ncbi:MAG TPA: retron Ec67 family RNA-directed DNA polymerase/endonuclease [Oligoflexia bacterium]|nr:retron Ec67 family RNA-directed DNA polymerase/endonuclease [Oligoflexia bacterium]HMP49438.1 retron Ec67 family RNA-directed DNA polymerase/endonuclease [Oligoflexia bacterium]
MSTLQKLKSCKDISDLATLLDTQAKSLSYILYVLKDERKYSVFRLKKKAGMREISAPTRGLGVLQKKLLRLLEKCNHEIAESKVTQDRYSALYCSQAYKKSFNLYNRKFNFGTFTNASFHTNRRFVFNIDLKDFFATINFGRVRGLFISNKNYSLNDTIATILAQIICFQNTLPQGSPVSPLISNMISESLDFRLLHLARKCKCLYTRYSDDITFSSNAKNFPYEIAVKHDEPEGNYTWNAGSMLSNIIIRSGFEIHEGKTRMQVRNSRQSVTGLIVNQKPNVPRQYYKYLRSMCHSIFKYHTYEIPELIGKGSNKPSLKKLEGMLNYVYDISKKNEQSQRKSNSSEENSVFNAKYKLFAKFLFYKHFIANAKTLILTEGYTDQIYLKCAAKNLKDKNSLTLRYEIDYLDLTERTKSILGYLEAQKNNSQKTKGNTFSQNGVPFFMPFIKLYREHAKNYSAKLNSPIIILTDSDAESEKFKENLKKLVCKQEDTEYFETTMPDWHFIGGHLYTLSLPKLLNRESKVIEDYFDEDLLNCSAHYMI